MPRRDWTYRLRDIHDAATAIMGYVAGMNYEQFVVDQRTVDAVIRNLAVIGEAANSVPEDVRQRYPDVEWDGMRRMRNFVVHVYFGVDTPLVWKTVQEDLPPLMAQMHDILKSLTPRQ